MIKIKLIVGMFIFSQMMWAGFDLNKRWINPNGWATPDLSKLSLVKKESYKDGSIVEITKKTYHRKKYNCIWRSNKGLPGYKISKEIEIAEITYVEVFECKEINLFPVYLMGLDVIHSRSKEYGDLITSTIVILADINNDGIYESQFDGAQETIKPWSFSTSLIKYIILKNFKYKNKRDGPEK